MVTPVGTGHLPVSWKDLLAWELLFLLVIKINLESGWMSDAVNEGITSKK